MGKFPPLVWGSTLPPSAEGSPLQCELATPSWTPLLGNSPSFSTLWKLSHGDSPIYKAACPSPTKLSGPAAPRYPNQSPIRKPFCADRLRSAASASLWACTEALLPAEPGPVSSRSPTPNPHSCASTVQLSGAPSPTRADPSPNPGPVSCAFRRSQASARSSSDTGGGEVAARGPWPGANDPLAPPLRGRGGGSSAPRKRSRARRAARAHHQPPPMVRTTAAAPRPALRAVRRLKYMSLRLKGSPVGYGCATQTRCSLSIGQNGDDTLLCHLCRHCAGHLASAARLRLPELIGPGKGWSSEVRGALSAGTCSFCQKL